MATAEDVTGVLNFKMNTLFGLVCRSTLLFLPLICFGDPSNVAPDLASADPHSKIDVIVQFVLPPSDDDMHGVNQLGGVPQEGDLDLIRAKLYTIPAKAVAALANNPNVAYISPDRDLSPTLDYANPTIGAQTAFSYGWTGAGVGVAVIDSGILTENDLLNKGSRATRIVYSQSFVPKVTSTIDQYGHGTHVAGIVAGNGAASTGVPYIKTFRGMAPDTNLINLRVLDANGARDRQLRNRCDQRGHSTENQVQHPRHQLVAWPAGLRELYARSALSGGGKSLESRHCGGGGGRQPGPQQTQGTNGYATITAPGNDPLVITVGAMKTMGTPTRFDDLIASYSSKGPTLIDHVVKPDIVAPGNRIISLEASKSLVVGKSGANLAPLHLLPNPIQQCHSADYYRLSGTSMAAPMVSGAAALMLGRDSTLTPDTVKARLMKSATKTFPLYSTAIDPVTGARTPASTTFSRLAPVTWMSGAL